MATAQLDPKLLRSIRTTQRLLGEHICKPPLLEKYLAKPPFRFLHDIVCSVITNTNFLKDVFSQHELKYDNVSSPDDKRAFLKKAIDAIEASSGETSTARTSKILAGKEPEKTNELLHLLAKAITNAARVRKDDEREIRPLKKGIDSNDNEARSKVKEDSDVQKSAKTKPPSRTAIIKSKPSQAIPKDKHGKPAAVQKKVVERPKPAAPSTTSVKKMASKPEVSKRTPPPSSSLAKKPSSSSNLYKAKSKTALTSRSKPSPSKLTSFKTDIRKGKSNEKVGSKASASHIGAKRDPSNSQSVDDPMRPLSLEEIPLQRPVTRTKYRQGNTTDGTKSGSKEYLTSGDPFNDEVASMDGEEANHDSSEEESTTCSSEEVITEHMNEKISEWRATSAEAPEQDPTFKRGWIHSEAEQGNGNNVGSVFVSEENCSVERTHSHHANSEKGEEGPANRNRQISKRPVTVIMDNEEEDDEDESYVVQERKESLDDVVKQSFGLVNAASDMGLLSQDNRSLLVNQILETQRELENFSDPSGLAEKQRELAERDQEVLREIYMKQIEDLKEAIQKITKCANPFANITQRSQDDACLMEIEYRKLRQENERLDRRLDQAKAETSRILYPYTEELANLDKCIEKMEGAVALAKQRLHIMDEEFCEDFIEQIAQTPTADEIIEEDHYQEGAKSNPLWGGIPHSDVIRDDEEYEQKMRNTSMQKVFQMAIDMHEGSTGNYDGFNPGQMQRKNFARLSKSKQQQQQRLQGHIGGGGVNPNGRRHPNVAEFFGGGYVGNGPAVTPQARQGQQYQSQQHQQQQQFFGYEGRGAGAPQQYTQRGPPLESEIRPTWWD